MRRARALLAVAALVGAFSVVCPAAARPPETRTQIVHLRAWTVTLTYQVRPFTGLMSLTRLHLRATAGDSIRIDRDLPLPGICLGGGCEVFGGPASILEVRDLGGSTPTAVLWLYSGGAHCCSIAEIVPLDRRPLLLRNFGDPGARIIRVGTAALFRTADDRFAYLYTSYAASAFPLALFRLRGGHLVDVTSSYRGRIAGDARTLWTWVVKVRRQKQEVRGLFAAWAADACRLSGRARVEKVADTFARTGVFSPPFTEPGPGPTGSRFPAVLLRDLTRWGYCRPG